jgi:hypothetical protein
MPGWSEIKSSIYGAYRLARLDAGGMADFNLSVEGFWRSFFAAVIVAPAYAALLMVRISAAGHDAPDSGPMPESFSIAPEVLSYAIGWILWPLVMLALLRLLGNAQNYVPYIIAYNWTNVIQIAFLLPVAVLTRGDVFPEQMAAIVSIVATLMVLFYLWFITRTALQIGEGAAAGIVIMDVLLGVLTSSLIDRAFS